MIKVSGVRDSLVDYVKLDKQIALEIFSREKYIIIRYSYCYFIAEEGFDGADKTWLYGKFDSAAKVRARLAEMRRDRK